MPASSNAIAIQRADYTPPAHSVDRVNLTIAIHADHAVVTSRLETRRCGDGPLVLRGGDGMRLDSLTINGEVEDTSTFDTSAGRIEVTIPDEAVVETVTTIDPFTNSALEGLYLSGGMLCTQCEPEGFRRITWHPDRPDVLGVFTTRIEAPASYPVLLANGNLIEEGTMEGGRHFAVWHDPFPKPSYLFAMVAGDLDHVTDHYTTMDGRDVELRIYVEHGNAHLTGHAMESLKRSMKWDEDVYGLAYDLDIFMIVAVSHFNMGAMENKGLNIFNSKFILADQETASDGDLIRVEAIVAHEYFHNWTGNRITCRDWFQLTLKEGLTVYREQEFTADLNSRVVKRSDDVALLRAIQFPEDNGPTAHPIRPEEYSEINNFYTPTVYEKGSEVIRMIATILGHDGFMQGMKRYVESHDGAAVTCEDFILAMEQANDADLGQFRRWYSQAGTPRLEITCHYDDQATTLSLNLRQALPETAAHTPRQPLVIPVRLGLVGPQGETVPVRVGDGQDGIEPPVDEAVVVLNGAESNVTLHDVPKGTVPSLLRGFSSPVQLTTNLTDTDRLHLLAHDGDAFCRWDAGQVLMLEAIRAILQDGKDVATTREKVERLAAGFTATLGDNRLDGAEKAQILRPPSQSVLEGMIPNPDPVLIWQARQNLLKMLGVAMADDITAMLDSLMTGKGQNTAQGRALIIRLLGLAVMADLNGAEDTALALSSHRNMTLAEGALAALNQTSGDARAEALKAFADKWADSSLVMEKWFALEASDPCVSTPEHCEALMQHPAFDPGNPNKLRSVLSVFGAMNTANFHANDGSGYAFLARHIASIDQRNPQVAARIALPLTRFSSYADDRQAMMKSALAHIMSKGDISPDLQEVVSKALNKK